MRRFSTVWGVGSAAALVVGAAAARAAPLAPGQEWIYAGTAQWKLTGGDAAREPLTATVHLSALVTEAEAGKGSAVILMRQVKADQRGAPSDVNVVTVRYKADRTPSALPSPTGNPLGALVQQLSVPLFPRVGLKAGDQWRATENVAPLPIRTEMVYSVNGETKVGERSALTIEKKPAQALPIKQSNGQGTLELTEYGEAVTVDPETGGVLGDHLHGSARLTDSQQVTLEFSASADLKETRQLSADELASRLKQAGTLERVQRSVFSPQPGVDRRKAIAQGVKVIAGFRRDYPNSPYASVAAGMEGMLGLLNAEAEREARLSGLKGGLAPPFTLKNLAGKEQSLGAYRGKIILLNFFASW